MAAPTNCYCDYATGNDYKGATFTDGAYTSATKTLVKLNAFAASKVNHWLKLDDNGSGVIVDGYYKIATWTDASTVILATDAGAGSDATDVKCTQHDGTTSLPWRSVQGALDLITRDATNGDQVNVKAGTAVVNQASLYVTTYGTPSEGAPLTIRGYTSTANDGAVGEIDCGGFAMFAATNLGDINLIDLEIHSFGNNNGITATGLRPLIFRCEVHKGASSPSSKTLIVNVLRVISCYVHDAGTTGIGIQAPQLAYGNYCYNCPSGGIYAFGGAAINNIIVDCGTVGIPMADGGMAIGNSIYSSAAATGKGISAASGLTGVVILNNIIEGYSGAGGIGISGVADISLIGHNAFYNNTTPESLGDVYCDLGNDATLAASPFVDAANGNFALNTAVAGAIDGAFPGAWYGPAATTDHADIGAVQNPAGTGGAVKIMPLGKVGL